MKSFMQSEQLEGYTLLCSLDQLKEFEGRRFFVDDVDIALFRIGDEVFAINNVCPHQQSALIYDGFVEMGYVVCPAHGWMFDIRTGKTPTGSKGLGTHEVKIIDNSVYVKVRKKDWNW